MNTEARLGKNHESLQQENRELVLKLLSFPPKKISRKELSQITGLTPATITNVTKNLIEKNIVRETEEVQISGQKGRRAISLEVNPNGRKVIGVRLARNYIIGGLFNLNCKVLHTERVNISAVSQIDNVIKSMKDIIRTLIEKKESSDEISTIGIATPGPLSVKEGKITLVSNFPSWRNIPIREIIYNEFGINTVIEHDAHAAALAEKRFGLYGDSKTLIYIAAGRGLGAGIITEHGIFNGTSGNAGQIGHTSIDYNGPICECGNRGCLELYSSSTAVYKKVLKEFENNKVNTSLDIKKGFTADDVLKVAASDDVFVRETITESARLLGIGIVNLINIFEPDTVVLGDEMSTAGDFWFDTVKETILSNTFPEISRNIRIKKESLEGDNFLVGTGAIALENLFKNI
ncbi:ROK family transcriptional regulator [Bacillus sp. Marseille-P3661]|uniref:ROK family transcriptional regulator n=1 Tax=Bacillus sp. Marseille-P3661 TaxID=1936234 RepID=UPI000C847925|nr:ROK family transcriptional regulator [Bacillus sp. Marseille-P3661]